MLSLASATRPWRPDMSRRIESSPYPFSPPSPMLATAFLAALACTLVTPASAYGQACCGRIELPVGSLERSGATSRTLVIGMTYEYSQLSIEEDLNLDFMVRAVQTSLWTIDVSYGVTNWFTPSIVFPFVLRTQDSMIAGEEANRLTGGVGDPLLLLKFMIWGHRYRNPRAFRLYLGAGVKFPLGTSDDVDDYGPLPSSFQSGSGAFDLVGALYFTWGPATWMLMTGSFLYRYPFENDVGLRFGDAFTVSLDLHMRAVAPVSIVTGLRAQIALTDTQDEVELEVSGGWSLFARIGLAAYLNRNFNLSLSVVIPVYQDLAENQLAATIKVMLGATMSFNL